MSKLIIIEIGSNTIINKDLLYYLSINKDYSTQKYKYLKTEKPKDILKHISNQLESDKHLIHYKIYDNGWFLYKNDGKTTYYYYELPVYVDNDKIQVMCDNILSNKKVPYVKEIHSNKGLNLVQTINNIGTEELSHIFIKNGKIIYNINDDIITGIHYDDINYTGQMCDFLIMTPDNYTLIKDKLLLIINDDSFSMVKYIVNNYNPIFITYDKRREFIEIELDNKSDTSFLFKWDKKLLDSLKQ